VVVTASAHAGESVAAFAERARAWLADNMPRIDPQDPPYADRGDEASWRHVRELQRRLYDGGFAGICFPTEYGGLGLDIEYQKAFDAESTCYEMPLILNTPTFTICCPTILDTGSEEQKRQHISAALSLGRPGSGRSDRPG
jgi:alkylation response protein AidB-like acyl-CoA dehydrogenase